MKSGIKPMIDQAANHLKDPLTLALAGLGITFAPHEWIGGMFLAMAAAALAMRADPEQDVRELWLVMLGAFLASHLAALVWQAWPSGWVSMQPPVQVAMICAGFLSRRVTRFALRMAGMVEARSDKIADRVIDRVLGSDDHKGGDK